MTTRIINDTEETIAIGPGESVDVKAIQTASKGTVSKLKRIRVKDVTSDGN